MSSLVPVVFKLPKNYDKDNLDSTTNLKKLKPNTEYLLPDKRHITYVQYYIDNHEPTYYWNTRDREPLRIQKFTEDSELFEYNDQWGKEYNTYIQYHIQGFVHFGKVTVYQNSDTEFNRLPLNTEDLYLSYYPIEIKKVHNLKYPHHRNSDKLIPTYESDLIDGFVATVPRNLEIYYPSSGILKYRLFNTEFTKEFYTFLPDLRGDTSILDTNYGKLREKFFRTIEGKDPIKPINLVYLPTSVYDKTNKNPSTPNRKRKYKNVEQIVLENKIILDSGSHLNTVIIRSENQRYTRTCSKLTKQIKFVR